MRIALDVQAARRSGKTGHGYYVQGLLDGLRGITDVDLVELAPKQDQDLNTVGRFLWDQVRLPKLASAAGADLLHATCFSVPRRGPRAKVATIHDLSLRLFPGNMGGLSGWFLREYVPRTYRRATRVVAVSQATADDAVRLLGLPDRSISVVHEAASPFYVPQVDPATLSKFALEERRYLLFVGTLEPRKNLPFLIRTLLPILPSLGVRLVIVGKVGWQSSELFDLVEGRRDVLFTGYVSDEEKRALYSSCAAFLFPSMYEGFGLPILEAAQCGAPVLVADNSSLPEVLGEGGMVLPIEERAWAEAVQRVISDDVLWHDLRTRAVERARQFSWEKAARETAAVYRQALEAGA